jgi:hypothetical protein
MNPGSVNPLGLNLFGVWGTYYAAVPPGFFGAPPYVEVVM